MVRVERLSNMSAVCLRIMLMLTLIKLGKNQSVQNYVRYTMKHIYFCLKNILAKQIIKMFLFDKSKEHLPCCLKFSIIWSLILGVGRLSYSRDACSCHITYLWIWMCEYTKYLAWQLLEYILCGMRITHTGIFTDSIYYICGPEMPDANNLQLV